VPGSIFQEMRELGRGEGASQSATYCTLSLQRGSGRNDNPRNRPYPAGASSRGLRPKEAEKEKKIAIRRRGKENSPGPGPSTQPPRQLSSRRQDVAGCAAKGGGRGAWLIQRGNLSTKGPTQGERVYTGAGRAQNTSNMRNRKKGKASALCKTRKGHEVSTPW